MESRTEDIILYPKDPETACFLFLRIPIAAFRRGYSRLKSLPYTTGKVIWEFGVMVQQDALIPTAVWFTRTDGGLRLAPLSEAETWTLSKEEIASRLV